MQRTGDIQIKPESLSLAIIVHASVTKTLHKRIVEKRQNHPIQPDMCPIIESYISNSVLWLIDCSSSEMKIEDNRHHAFAAACVGFLEHEKKNFTFLFVK